MPRPTDENDSPSRSSQVQESKQKSQRKEVRQADEMDEDEPTNQEPTTAAGQEAADTKQIRAKYRQLQSQLEDARKDLMAVELEVLSNNVESADDLFSRVKKTTEAVLDSRVLLAASDAGALKARQLKIDTNAFDVDDFFQKLARFMGGRVNKANRLNVNQSPLKWERAGRVLGAQSRRIPGINLMFGPLAVEVKERKKSQRKATQKFDPKEAVRPDMLDNQGNEEKEKIELTRLVTNMAKILSTRVGINEPIPVLSLVTNPFSYTETVENLFHLAFLVKEGKVALEVDDSGPYKGDLVVILHDEQVGTGGDNEPKEQNHVFEMSEELWRQAIEAYDLHDSMIPTRYKEAPQ